MLFFKSLLIILISTLWSCSTDQGRRRTLDPLSPSPQSRPAQKSSTKSQLDLSELQQELGLGGHRGYQQKPFNDCILPEAYRLKRGCSTQYFTLIQFRLQCRASMGTVNIVRQD